MSHLTASALFSFSILCTLAIGCGNNATPQTLVVHYHDGVYDLINHEGEIVDTAKDLDEFETLLKTPAVKSLIRGKRIIARFAGTPKPDGLISPTEVNLLMGRLIHADVDKMDLEYTNDPH